MSKPADGIAWRKSTHSGTSGGGCVEVGTTWRKSGSSGSSGGACVEVGTVWRTSTHSGSSGGDCVEVGTASRVVVVRDTTNRSGGVLAISPAAWWAFTSALR